MLKDAKLGSITALRATPSRTNGAPLKEIIDAFIEVQVESMGEPQPRKHEVHMDKVKPAALLRQFKAHAKNTLDCSTLYTNVGGVDKYHFTDSYFRQRWSWRLKHGLPR